MECQFGVEDLESSFDNGILKLCRVLLDLKKEDLLLSTGLWIGMFVFSMC